MLVLAVVVATTVADKPKRGLSGIALSSSPLYSSHGLSSGPLISSHGLSSGLISGHGLGVLASGPGIGLSSSPVLASGGGVALAGGQQVGQPQLISRDITIRNRIAIPVAQPYPVHIDRPVPYPVPHPVRVPVDQPYAVKVSQFIINDK